LYTLEEKDKEEEKEKLMSEVKIDDCKLDKKSIGFKVMDASIKLYNGFCKEFPFNKDLKAKTSREWIKPVRVLMEKKNYEYEDHIKPVLLWALENDFWKTKIIDTETLEKHFEKLKIQYQNG
jgi:hypothetical protein